MINYTVYMAVPFKVRVQKFGHSFFQQPSKSHCYNQKYGKMIFMSNIYAICKV